MSTHTGTPKRRRPARRRGRHTAEIPPKPDRVLDLPPIVELTNGERWPVPSGALWRFPHDRRGQLNTGLLDGPLVERERDALGRSKATVWCYAPDLVRLMRLFMLDLLTLVSPSGVQNYLSGFAAFGRWLQETGRVPGGPGSVTLAYLTVAAYDAFRVATERTSSRGAYPRALRAFYAWARHQDGWDRRTDDVIQGLALKKALTGKAARLRCPRNGALDQWEQDVLALALADEAGGAEYREHRAVARLFRETGIRPYAATLLTRGHVTRAGDAGDDYVLSVPRVKKKGTKKTQAKRYADTYEVKVTATLWHELLALRNGNAHEALPLTLGLFPALDGDPTGVAAVDRLHHLLADWAEAADLRTVRVPVAGVAGPPYPSTRLRVHPQRFRRTIATNLAEQGYPADLIAALLDDDSLAMAAVYAENSASMVDLLAATLDKHPEWRILLRLFRGEVLAVPDADLPVVVGGAPWLDHYPEFARMGVLGQCACPVPCDFRPPLTCYLCRYFRPWPDAPHGQQLTQLRRHAEGRIGRTSDRLLNVLRRVDGAICQVVAKSAEILEAREASPAAKTRAARPRSAPLALD